MSRIQLNDSWQVVNDSSNLRSKLTEFFNRHKMEIIDKQDDVIHIRQGSQMLTRLLGGWFVPPSWFPKLATVKIRKTEKEVRIEAHLEENLGFGILDPIFKKKYQKYFELWMAELKETTLQ